MRQRRRAHLTRPKPNGMWGCGGVTAVDRPVVPGRCGCNGEVACKRDSVSVETPGDHPSVRSTRGVSVAGQTGRSSPLLDLASGGVYQADNVAVAAGALLPHRFSLACCVTSKRDTHRRSLSVARPSGRPNLALASTMPCEVPTFLDGITRRPTAAITRSPHRCNGECTRPTDQSSS